MIQTLFRCGLVLLPAVVQLPAGAGPVADEFAVRPAKAESAASASGPVRDASDGKKTVELLLEMQPRSAGLDFKDRKLPQRGDVLQAPQSGELKPGTQPGRSPEAEDAEARAANTRQGPPSGLFGSGATNPAAATPRADSQRAAESSSNEPWRPTGERTGERSTQRSTSSSPSEPSGNFVRLWTVPREIIEFIRDNREWFMGALAVVLVVVWLTSAAAARNR